MSDFSVAGLASGIDTTALLDGLMFAERATQRRLQASKADEQRALDAWSEVGRRLASVTTAVDAIRTGGALEAATAQSSDDGVARVTARSGALAGSYSFRVSSLAAANQVASAGLTGATAPTGAGTAVVTGGLAGLGVTLSGQTLQDGTYQIDVLSVDAGTDEAVVVFDGEEQTVDVSGPAFTLTSGAGTVTLAGAPTVGSAAVTVVVADETTTVGQLVSKLNAPGGPVRAQLIDTGDDSATPVRLVVGSRATGLDGAAGVDLGGLALFSGGMTELRAASDAVVTLGTGPSALTVSRSTNSITDLFAGLTVDLVGTSPDADVELAVTGDVDAQVQAVTNVVDRVSDVLRYIATQARYDVDAGTGGALVGDFTGRQVSAEIQRAMGTVLGSGPFVLLSQLGVAFQRDGTYRVDEVALREALAGDPDGVRTVLVGDPGDDGDGVLDVVAATVDRFDDDTGRVSTASRVREESIEALDRLIALQDVRLENVQDRYRRQFAALESLLGQLQGQSSYLSSAIGNIA